jgi:DNA helicase HerA-like ATPase
VTELDVVGTIIRGQHGSIVIRQRSDAEIELGDLLVAEQETGGYTILQVYDLAYGSQIAPKSLEMITGMQVEGFAADLAFTDARIRNYVLAEVKALLKVQGTRLRLPKTLPRFMRELRHVTEKDLSFLVKPAHPVFLGNVRSGSKVLPVDTFLDGRRMFAHHVLIPATTGRGKSNLVKVMIWSILDNDDFGALILDPHDEYYGRHGKGLKDHPSSRTHLRYYTAQSLAGALFPVFNLRIVKPRHFRGVVPFTDAQREAMAVAINEHGDDWLAAIAHGEQLPHVDPRTLAVLRRRMDTTLGLYEDDQGQIQCRTRTFSDTMGASTLLDILDALTTGKKVIIDTSLFSDQVELLVGSIVLHEILYRYRRFKREGVLATKPVISIIIEEAPRVIGSDALAAGSNVYSTIAREGRKFQIGLTAITQLASLIPRTVLANMNTKVILGNELGTERQAVITSAAQDLSKDDSAIASLDVGEAIVSSNFTKFAVPVQIPLFEDYIQRFGTRKPVKIGFV